MDRPIRHWQSTLYVLFSVTHRLFGNKMVQNCSFELNLIFCYHGQLFWWPLLYFWVEIKKTCSWNCCLGPSNKLMPQFKPHLNTCQYPLINYLDLCTRFYHLNTRRKSIIYYFLVTLHKIVKKKVKFNARTLSKNWLKQISPCLYNCLYSSLKWCH